MNNKVSIVFCNNFPKETDNHSTAGVCGFIGWQRLITNLVLSGEISKDEKVGKIVVDGDGITYIMKDNE